jgi:hypothetical protein
VGSVDVKADYGKSDPVAMSRSHQESVLHCRRTKEVIRRCRSKFPYLACVALPKCKKLCFANSAKMIP